jgi:hypothetical protein
MRSLTFEFVVERIDLTRCRNISYIYNKLMTSFNTISDTIDASKLIYRLNVRGDVYGELKV